MGSVWSVQCQVVHFSGLYLFSRPIVLPQMQGFSINFRVLIGCTCDFQGVSPFPLVILASLFARLFSVLFPTYNEGMKVATYVGSLVQLCCGKGGTCTGMCVGVLTVDGSHWVCHSPRGQVLPGSPLLRLQSGLQGYCPKCTLFLCNSQV